MSYHLYKSLKLLREISNTLMSKVKNISGRQWWSHDHDFYLPSQILPFLNQLLVSWVNVSLWYNQLGYYEASYRLHILGQMSLFINVNYLCLCLIVLSNSIIFLSFIKARYSYMQLNTVLCYTQALFFIKIYGEILMQV